MSQLSAAAESSSVPSNETLTGESYIHLSYRDGTGAFHAEWPISQIDPAIHDQGGLLWVDIQGPEEHTTDHLENFLCDHFHFHHLAVEDALRENHVPKIDDWD